MLEVDNFGGEAFQQCKACAFFKINYVVFVDISIVNDDQEECRYYRCILRHLAAIHGDAGNNAHICNRLLVVIEKSATINVIIKGTSKFQRISSVTHSFTHSLKKY